MIALTRVVFVYVVLEIVRFGYTVGWDLYMAAHPYP